MTIELTIVPDFLDRLIFKMRAVMLDDEDAPRDARDNAVGGTHHLTLREEVGSDLTRQELIDEIDEMDPEHQHELMALMWVGRGDFGAEEWDEALLLAAERSDRPTSEYLLDHPMAADDIASGLEVLGHDHILLDGKFQAAASVGFRRLGQCLWVQNDDRLRGLQSDDRGGPQLGDRAADGFDRQPQKIGDIGPFHRKVDADVVAVRRTDAVCQHHQKGRNLFQRRFARQHHEVILHGADFTQGRLQQALLGFGVARASIQCGARMDRHLAGFKHIAVGVVIFAIGKTDHIARQGKGDDLPAPVHQHAGQAQDAGFDLIDVGGFVTLAVNACTHGDAAGGAVQV